jgi:hypothetical protein
LRVLILIKGITNMAIWLVASLALPPMNIQREWFMKIIG